jgi:hypothetical protein
MSLTMLIDKEAIFVIIGKADTTVRQCPLAIPYAYGQHINVPKHFENV